LFSLMTQILAADLNQTSTFGTVKRKILPMKSYEELFPNVNNDTVSLKNMNQSVDALEGSVLRKLHSSVDFRRFEA